MSVFRIGAIGAMAATMVGTTLASGQAIRGQLLDAERGFPLPSGLLSLLVRDTTTAAVFETDSAGRFVIAPGRAGAFRIRAYRAGYQTAVSPVVKVVEGDTLDVEFRLSAATVMLEPMVVTARSRRIHGPIADFYDRAASGGFGNFLTREQIERARAYRTTDILRRLPGIRLEPAPIGGGSHITIRGNCSPTTFIDGTRVRMGNVTVDDLVNPRDLEGVELYRSASEAPPQFGGIRGGCGILMLWTRRSR